MNADEIRNAALEVPEEALDRIMKYAEKHFIGPVKDRWDSHSAKHRIRGVIESEWRALKRSPAPEKAAEGVEENRKPFYGRADYSDDRKSLAQEIRETFWAHDLTCPNTDGPDLITRIGMLVSELDQLQSSNARLRKALEEAVPYLLAYAKNLGGEGYSGMAKSIRGIAEQAREVLKEK